MQASQKHGISGRSGSFYSQPVPEDESCQWPILNIEHNSCSDDGSQGIHLSGQTYCEQYCTLESSSATGSFPVYISPSTVSFSPEGSPVSQQDSQTYPSDQPHSPENEHGSPISGSCVTDDVNELRHKLRELETAMLGPDSDILDVHEVNIPRELKKISSEREKWKQMMEVISRGDLKEVLVTCAKAVADNDILRAEWGMSELRQMVSVSGEPIQRLGAYMLEGLVARLAASGSSIYKALRCKEPASVELLSYMHLLYEICPYFKFGYMSGNGAIAEAMKDESKVHIIDFQIAQGSQWITLIQALAARPGGPPQIRITGIDDSTSAYARGGGLSIVGQRLSRFAESCKVPFEFHAAAISGCEIQLDDLELRPGEALAVNFALMLHHMPDESVDTQNHRDRLLRLVKSLSPKVVSLVEQESNTNTAPFLPRFIETMNYYLAVFESIDVTLPRDHKERINVEQHCLAREIVNIIACEGAERVERHELLGKWKSRFLMAGFTPCPLSSFVNATIKTLLENYCDKYSLEERDGALYLGWMDRALVAACAWSIHGHFCRFGLPPTILKMPGSTKLVSWVAKGVASGLDALYLTRFEFQRTEYWRTLYSSVGLGAPFLILCSKHDDLAPYQVVCNFSHRLQDLGADVKLLKWNNSLHAGHYRQYPTEYRAAVTELLERAASVHLQKIQLEGERAGMEGTQDEISELICNLQKAAVNSNQSLRRVAIEPSDHFFLPSSAEYQNGRDSGPSADEQRERPVPVTNPPSISAHSVLGQFLFDVCVPKNIEGWDIKFSGSLNGQPLASARRYSPQHANKCPRRSRL